MSFHKDGFKNRQLNVINNSTKHGTYPNSVIKQYSLVLQLFLLIGKISVV